MSSKRLTTQEYCQEIERQRFIQFGLTDSDPRYRPILTFLNETWATQQERYFESLPDADNMQPPHFTLGCTPPHMFAMTSQYTGWGATIQTVVSDELCFDKNGPHRNIRNRFPAPGTSSFVEDCLLHEHVHQYQIEVRGITEVGYEGHGPEFTAQCNRITPLLGLEGTVIARRRGVQDRNARTSAHWPMNLRPQGYYARDVIYPAPRQTVSRGRYSQVRQLNADEGLIRYLLHLVDNERIVDAKLCMRRWLDARMTAREPMWAEHEKRPHNHHGEPVATPELDVELFRSLHNAPRYLAESVVKDARFDLLPILADALQDAGCEDAVFLDHCRSNREHSVRCWVVKLLVDLLRRINSDT